MVVADDDALARVLAADDISGNRVGNSLDVIEREVVGDNAPPAISAKTNLLHGSEV